MESEETRRKTIDVRHEYLRQLGITMGKLLFAIGIALLFLSLVWSVFFRPVGVFSLCLGATCYIMSKHEEWFYLKRTTKSSTEPK